MIKASFEIIQPANGQSFLFRKFDRSAFEAPYHFHPEYELTYIIEGTGKRYAGSHMGDFSAGDLVLLGPNLPHCWKLEQEKDSQTNASAIVVQFDGAFLGDDFFNKNEMQLIRKLFQKSGCGICFKSATQAVVDKNLEALSKEKNNFRMLMGLLEILQKLALSNDYILLDQNRSVAERTPAEQERINPVYAYLVENFRSQVSLEAAAGIANMTTNAFCKYFKKITRKTFMETIIEYRLNYATQQLVQTDKPVSDISYESGFGDVSHFYKMFKQKMHISPLNYRKKFMRDLEDEAIIGVA
ncbi:AraC family transcriptional regulator [Mucilaginibacter gotjawali]|uniref:AraC-like DNA-binding protein n=2 Tax=Mucilaginibacter gotjawali TaxID=1550579 RepID=A0A839SHW2_9SPHI|nr:AraC family transcriptional regulator [Mucilaginibacter gotjawali]MBB3056179.1 AraC-like DNA-binding protein [Mucilaginibacter gotjawali]BAU53480.1 Bifunctional transcriptional activator/DNA repair enzyme AdaA [Mucilaginibacter gotjawali]